MANEFQGLKLKCVEPDYIPYGNGYPDRVSEYRGCGVIGSDANGLIDGVAYIHGQYNYSVGHIWRGFGVIAGMWVFFIGLTAFGFELHNNHGGSSMILYKRDSQRKQASDEEKGDEIQPSTMNEDFSQTPKQSIFTWNNLEYHVPFRRQKKQLLNNVFGFVKPGNLVALMGSSGAGKTT